MAIAWNIPLFLHEYELDKFEGFAYGYEMCLLYGMICHQDIDTDSSLTSTFATCSSINNYNKLQDTGIICQIGLHFPLVTFTPVKK